ncbi:MAG: methyltransferase domain-containing protein [Syntrophorhabdales bacterium]
MARKEHWLGTTERRGLLLKRFRRFLAFLPHILTFRRRRVRGYLCRSSLIRAYLSSAGVKKLQLGAAGNVMDGWLNTSFRPRSPGIVFLDVTEPFPFGHGVFDYVLSEHLIEHLPYNDGRFMLAECFRVLKPGGKIRLSTPDLGMLAGLLSQRGEKDASYVRWIASNFPGDVPVASTTIVVNNLFYNWGHRFLYDFAMMKSALEETGFTGVTACEVGVSDDAALHGVELHRGKSTLDEEMSAFEALVVEATRP